MAEHQNVAIVRNAYESFAKGDLDGALADLADDCVFHFGGDGPAGRTSVDHLPRRTHRRPSWAGGRP
jgi:ketosteroid isomerase-like protein